ncbi:MAG: sigma-70 family RNA polymerase sigma factor, partial [Acidimicrobiia bacterium]|nr:sigma-70 family RNA polymerase sigma factor [Acidimicrobiia bacterium]
ANRFDPDLGVPFAAFATKTILGQIKRHRRDTGWSVHVGRRVKEVAVQLPLAVRTLSEELSRSPTPDEVGERLGVPTETVLDAMEAQAADRSVSSDRHAAAALSAVVSDDARFSTVDDRDALARWIERLGDTERDAVLSYFWGDLSQADVARRLGMSQMAVSRLLARALTRMRAWAAESA